MKRIRVIPIFFALVLALAACDSPTRPVFSRDGFWVSVKGRQLVLRNQSPGVIHYVALEAETAMRTDLQPRADLWPSLAAGAETQIPFEQMNGYTPAASQARIFWAMTERLQPSFLVDLR